MSELTQQELDEIELSFDFGRRLSEYYKSIIQRSIEDMSADREKLMQHWQSDRGYINDIIQGLETGEGIIHLHFIKERLTIVCQMLFKKEFIALKKLAAQY